MIWFAVMKKMNCLQLSLLFGMLAVGTAGAQALPDSLAVPPRSLLVGPTASVMYGQDRAAIPVFYGSDACGLFSQGRTLASSLGGILAFPSLLTSNLDLVTSLRFTFLSGRLVTSPQVPFRVLDSDTKELVEIEEEYRLNVVSLETVVDLLASLRLSDRFAVAAGPFFGYRLFSTFSQTENILAPEDFRLPNGHKEQGMVDGSNPEGSAFTFGPSIGAAYTIPLGSRRFLTPAFFVQTDLLSSVKEFSWRSHRAGFSLSLLFDVSPEFPELPPEEIPPPPRLAASVEMYGIDENDVPLPTARIQVYETLFQRHAPLLPAVFFDHNTIRLPERYVIVDSGQSEAFSTDMLAGTPILEIQHQALNIVGQRLQQKREAAVTLVGSVSKDEPTELKRLRAATVRSYLGQVWGIDSARLQVKDGVSLMERSNEETVDGREDNRRVEMASSDLSILAPVVTAQVIRDFDPPMIRMRPQIDAEAGVKEWTLVVSQGGNAIAQYSSHEEKSDSGEMVWRIVHDRVDSALSPLIATLTVEDSTGAVTTATSMLPLVMVRSPRVVNQRIERTGDRERLSYTLVGFDFSSADLGAQNNEVVKDITELVRNGSEITVMGYTDRIGDGKRNRELAMERAINVARTLQHLLEERGVEEVTLNVMGEGVETVRFDNDLPEGRVLSRGVSIVVEQRTDQELSQP